MDISYRLRESQYLCTFQDSQLHSMPWSSRDLGQSFEACLSQPSTELRSFDHTRKNSAVWHCSVRAASETNPISRQKACVSLPIEEMVPSSFLSFLPPPPPHLPPLLPSCCLCCRHCHSRLTHSLRPTNLPTTQHVLLFAISSSIVAANGEERETGEVISFLLSEMNRQIRQNRSLGCSEIYLGLGE